MLSNAVIAWFNDEHHEDLIDEGDLTKILMACPAAISSEVLSMIITTIPDSVHETEIAGQLYGVKSIDGRRTISLGRHNGTNYNINSTLSPGMKGGYQVGFKTIKDAVKFIKQLPSGLSEYRVSMMQVAIVKSYRWEKVDSIYGECYASNTALEQYDPIKVSARKEVNKIVNTIKREWKKYFFDKFETRSQEVKEAIFKEFSPLETIQPIPDPGFTKMEGKVTIIETWRDKEYFICIEDIAATEKDIPRIQTIIKNITGLDTKVHHLYTFPEKRPTIAGYIGNLWLDPRVSPEYTAIKTKIETKYGAA